MLHVGCNCQLTSEIPNINGWDSDSSLVSDVLVAFLAGGYMTALNC